MIWIALVVGGFVIAGCIVVIRGIDRIIDALIDQAERVADTVDRPRTIELPPLPACKCGSTALLLLNGYQRTRIVACQECAKVFGVNSDGVRFDRDPEAIPEYATQKAAREMMRSEIKQMEAKSRPERRPGREPLERPLP